MEMRIDVDFYNNEEKEHLSENYPNEFETFQRVVESGYVIVSFADFKTYSQMHHRNDEIGKLNSFRTIEQNIGDLYGNVKIYTQFNPETGRFYSELNNNNEQNHISESIGCGGALSVLGAIYGLTQADWQRIDIQEHKDFDFDSAVVENFDKMIVVEAKGSIVADNTSKTLFSNHKTNIKLKKKDKDFIEKYSNGTDLLIGAITVIDKIHHAKVFLVDPPIFSELNYKIRKKIKVLKRLIFYSQWINIISSRSNLAITLKNRINALSIVSDIGLFDMLVLTNTKGKALKVSDSFIKTRSNIDGKIVGNLHIINHSKAVFIGLPIEIYNIMALQDFAALNKFKVEAFIDIKRIDLKLSRYFAKQSSFLKNINLEYKSGQSVLFEFYVNDAVVFQNSAGLVYSIISTKNNYNLSNE